MKWSYTKSRIFDKCPRKWYYSEIVASPTTKNPLRREAYILRQLQSTHAWRGSVVDKVIEKLIVPGIKSGRLPPEEEVATFAKDLMEKQIKFGREKRYRDHNMKKSRIGDEYCAFYDVEYNGGLNDDVLQEAGEDVLVSLRNLLDSNLIGEIKERSVYIAAQRSLVFQLADTTVSCTPDLLVFFNDAPPTIIDWKVHSVARSDFWLQLGVYAVALSRTKPHKDFPKGIENQLIDPTAFRMIEYQLLKNKQRVHTISSEDIAFIEDYIFLSSMQMNNLLNGGKGFGELDAELFWTTHFPRICSTCQFKRLCWQKMSVQRSLSEVGWA